MADETLNVKVDTDIGSIDSSLMVGWPLPLINFFVEFQQYTDSIATKSNEAASGAYTSQVSTESQADSISRVNKTVSDQGVLISKVSNLVSSNNRKITVLEDTSGEFEGRLNDVEIKAEQNRSDIEDIQLDYVSKAETSIQVIASPIDVATSYSVDGTKVVGAQVTGFTSPTGTEYKGAFNADKTYTVSATYTQSEILEIAADLKETRQALYAALSVMRSHGLTD